MSQFQKLPRLRRTLRRVKKWFRKTWLFGTTVPWVKKFTIGFRTYGPNRSDKLALVSINDLRQRERFTAYWPLSITQIIGGKKWSINFIRYQTPQPVLVGPKGGLRLPVPPVDPDAIEGDEEEK